MATLVQNIEMLFVQVGSFEAGSKEFSARVFASNLDGILSALGMLRNQPEQSAEVDEVLYRKIRETESSQSLLRFAASNILGMFLFAYASGSVRVLRSYEELVRSRSENATNDGDFIERVLVPRLLALRALGGDSVLGAHLLLKVADYLQTFGAAPTFPSNSSRADLERRGMSTLLLGFARRRVESRGRLLREEPGALEYGLQRDRFFEWMSVQGRNQGLDVESYLRQLELLSAVSWWRRVLNTLKQPLAKRPTFRWIPAGGVVWSGFWILIAALLFVGVPWFCYDLYQKRLREFKSECQSLDSKKMTVLTQPSGGAQ